MSQQYVLDRMNFDDIKRTSEMTEKEFGSLIVCVELTFWLHLN